MEAMTLERAARWYLDALADGNQYKINAAAAAFQRLYHAKHGVTLWRRGLKDAARKIVGEATDKNGEN